MWRHWFCRDAAVIRDAPQPETFLVCHGSQLALGGFPAAQPQTSRGAPAGVVIRAAANAAGSIVRLALPRIATGTGL
jgi:hypothetical protein